MSSLRKPHGRNFIPQPPKGRRKSLKVIQIPIFMFNHDWLPCLPSTRIQCQEMACCSPRTVPNSTKNRRALLTNSCSKSEDIIQSTRKQKYKTAKSSSWWPHLFLSKGFKRYDFTGPGLESNSLANITNHVRVLFLRTPSLQRLISMDYWNHILQLPTILHSRILHQAF